MRTYRPAICCFLLGLFLLPGIATTQPAQSLLEKGEYHQERGRADSARFYYQRAYAQPSASNKAKALAGLLRVALQESSLATADSLVQVAGSLLENANLELQARCELKSGKGEYFRKRSRLEQALQEQREVIKLCAGKKQARQEYAYALFYTALTYERLAEYDSSLAYAQMAHPIFREELDTTSLKFSTIYNGMGACYFRANRLAEAKRYFLQSKAIAEEKLGPLSREVARCLNNLSAVARLEEDYLQAIAYGEEALRIYRALEDEDGAAGAYYSLGIYHYYLGDYGRAQDHLHACIAIRERLYSSKHYSLIGPYELLGITYEEAGGYKQTLLYLKKGRQAIAANYDSGSLPEGFNLENTAICFQSTSQLDSALHYMRRANAILLRLLPADDYALAVHHFSFANVLYEMGQPGEATAKLQQSNRIYEKLGLEESSEYALNLALQGLIYAGQNEWAMADDQFERALSKVQAREGNNTPRPMTPNTLELLNQYSGYLYRKYRYAGAEETLRQFENYSRIYLELSDNFRKQFIDPYTKSILAKDNTEVYRRNIGIYNHLYHRTNNPDYLQAAYTFSEYSRGTRLRDMQDDNRIRAYAGLPDSVLQRERTLRKKITDLNQQWQENPDSEAVREELFASKEALNTHLENTLQKYPRYYELKFNSEIPSLQDIQARLQPGHNIVEYMQDDTAYYALVIRPERCELLYLASRQAVDAAVQQWKEKLVARDDSAVKASGQWLYQKIWQPLESHLAGPRVIIVPAGPLFYLNFETLPGRAPDAPYLIYDYNLSYALSIATLFAKGEAAENGLLLVAAPGFEEEIKQQYRRQLDSLEQPDEEYLRTVRQPWSLRLAQKLRSQFTHQVYTGLEATEAQVKANLHRGQVLYFGTHAIADPSDPLRSKLVLAKEAGEQQEDGYLHAYELYGLPLQAQLAVLNACESGLGQLQAGEGMASLAYSLHYAGCAATAISLWKVDEKINTRITEDFLNYLSEGLSASEALRRAKLDYLADATPELQHPFYWGGMVLMGKDEVVLLEKKKRLWLFLLGGMVVLGLLAFWYWRK